MPLAPCPTSAAAAAAGNTPPVHPAVHLRAHLHWPMMTESPSWQRKQGEMWAEMLVWRFSYRWYFLMKCR